MKTETINLAASIISLKEYVVHILDVLLCNRNILCWWHLVRRAAFTPHMVGEDITTEELSEGAVQMVGEHVRTQEVMYAHPPSHQQNTEEQTPPFLIPMLQLIY